MAEQSIPSFEPEEGSNVIPFGRDGNGIRERVGFVFTASDDIGEYLDSMLEPSAAEQMGHTAHFLYSQFRAPVERLGGNKFGPKDAFVLRAMGRAVEAASKGSQQKPLAHYVTGQQVNDHRAVRLDFGVILNEAVQDELVDLTTADGRPLLKHYTMPVYWLQLIDNLRSAEATQKALNQLRYKLLSENEDEPWHPAKGMKLLKPSNGDGAYVTNMRLRSKRRS